MDPANSFLGLRRAASASNPRLIHRATALQRRYIQDRSALLTYLAGRRHGKTDAVATRMIENARPHTMQAFVAPTIGRGEEILLPIFRQLQRDVGLVWDWHGIHKTITLPSGGKIRIMGMSNQAEIQKLRGEDLLAAYFDECGVPSSELLKEAVISCAWEALRRHRGEPGSGASLSGTPGPLPEGFFWECTTKAMYGSSNHFGLIFDNPVFQIAEANGKTKAENSIQEDLDNRLYISREDSRFRREVLAQWCLPSELRCYSRFGGILLPDSSAPWEGRTVMAVDFGWHDHTAIVILRLVEFEESYPQADGSEQVVRGERVHVLYAEKRQHWKLPDLADRLRELQTTYSVGTCVGDSAGGSAQVVESFAGTFGVAMLPAQKSGMGKLKKNRIHTIDDLFGIGHISVYEGAACLAAELGWLVWDADRGDHDERQDDHCADAFGYAIIETYVPTTVERIASQLEQELAAREQRKRRALGR